MSRVGLGYDIHRLESGQRLILGGVQIPYSLGLTGHSDADVVVHALMDALLGAAGLSDIGTQFPPGDSRYRDISSLILLERVAEMVEETGYRLGNADVMIVAERPKIAPYVAQMRRQLADTLRVPVSALGLKATTNEGVGPEGRGEAISAQAVVLLETGV